jgi:uncharacterized protein YdeI (YjbR/CyaY-like superfamily)
MGKRIPEVDAYIDRAQPFARPILKKLRTLFHKACPRLEEKIKWGMPSFEYKGLLGGMAAFKHHVSWGFWKASLLNDPKGIMKSSASSPMSGGSPKELSELPDEDYILDLVRQAVVLNDRGVKIPKRSGKPKPAAKVPPDLLAALKKNAKARATFEQFSPSHRREYIEWITEARQDETRKRRLAQAIEWMAEGKPRNWKYMNAKKSA